MTTKVVNRKQVATWVDSETYERLKRLKDRGIKLNYLIRKALYDIEKEEELKKLYLKTIDDLKTVSDVLRQVYGFIEDLKSYTNSLYELSSSLRSINSHYKNNLEELKKLREKLNLDLIDIERELKELHTQRVNVKKAYEIWINEFYKPLLELADKELPKSIAGKITDLYGRVFKKTIELGLLNPEEFPKL